MLVLPPAGETCRQLASDRPDGITHLVELGARRSEEVDVVQVGLDAREIGEVELGSHVGTDQPLELVDACSDQGGCHVGIGDPHPAHEAGDVGAEEHALKVMAFRTNVSGQPGMLVDERGGERGEVATTDQASTASLVIAVSPGSAASAARVGPGSSDRTPTRRSGSGVPA